VNEWNDRHVRLMLAAYVVFVLVLVVVEIS
jgi:hypothetical protein